MLLWLVTFLVVFNSVELKCQDKIWENKCVRAHSEKKTWDDARNVCLSEGGRLLELRANKTEDSTLREVGLTESWVGARKHAWFWSEDGSAKNDTSPILTPFWFPSEPNGMPHEDRIGLYRHHNYLWNDDDYTARYQYKGLCSCDTCGNLTSASRSVTQLLTHKGHLYFTTSDSFVNWDEAWVICKRFNAKLVKVETKELQQKLQNELKKHGQYTYWTAGYWIDQRKYAWNSGSIFSAELHTMLEKQAKDNDCVSVGTSGNTVKVTGAKCCVRKPFICEFPADIPSSPPSNTMKRTSTTSPEAVTSHHTTSRERLTTTAEDTEDNKDAEKSITTSARPSAPLRPHECTARNITRQLSPGEKTTTIEVEPGVVITFDEGHYTYSSQNGCPVIIVITKSAGDKANLLRKCPSRIVGVVSPMTNLGSIELVREDGGIHRLYLPAGQYKYEAFLSGLNCTLQVLIVDYRIMRRLELSTHYRIYDCSALSSSWVKSTIVNYFRQLTVMCGKDCYRVRESNTVLTCEREILTVSWPTDAVFDGTYTDVPDDIRDVLTEKLMLFREQLVNGPDPLKLYPTDNFISLDLRTFCIGNLTYHPETNSCQ